MDELDFNNPISPFGGSESLLKILTTNRSNLIRKNITRNFPRQHHMKHLAKKFSSAEQDEINEKIALQLMNYNSSIDIGYDYQEFHDLTLHLKRTKSFISDGDPGTRTVGLLSFIFIFFWFYVTYKSWVLCRKYIRRRTKWFESPSRYNEEIISAEYIASETLATNTRLTGILIGLLLFPLCILYPAFAGNLYSQFCIYFGIFLLFLFNASHLFLTLEIIHRNLTMTLTKKCYKRIFGSLDLYNCNIDTQANHQQRCHLGKVLSTFWKMLSLMFWSIAFLITGVTYYNLYKNNRYVLLRQNSLIYSPYDVTCSINWIFTIDITNRYLNTSMIVYFSLCVISYFGIAVSLYTSPNAENASIINPPHSLVTSKFERRKFLYNILIFILVFAINGIYIFAYEYNVNDTANYQLILYVSIVKMVIHAIVIPIITNSLQQLYPFRRIIETSDYAELTEDECEAVLNGEHVHRTGEIILEQISNDLGGNVQRSSTIIEIDNLSNNNFLPSYEEASNKLTGENST
ncbi:hypothetical protein SNEBB_010153 [Seison nebaliae]|nr:hypothetical protein SNEBB_010153 [Seison nebaliae]